MTVRQLHQLHQLLRGLHDTREVVVREPSQNRHVLHAVWRTAQDEADSAYGAWCDERGPDAYMAYRAATDRSDAALEALAAEAR